MREIREWSSGKWKGMRSTPSEKYDRGGKRQKERRETKGGKWRGWVVGCSLLFSCCGRLRKWKPCRKKVREKGALGGNSVEQTRNKPGRRLPKVEE